MLVATLLAIKDIVYYSIGYICVFFILFSYFGGEGGEGGRSRGIELQLDPCFGAIY